MNPTISVLTATYNRASFLKGAIQSVRKQSFPFWEHLLIDDGSTDNTQAILNSLKQDNLRVFHTPNQGQAAALNVGIREAKGEYLAFLDSDDEYLPRHLELLYENIEGHELVLGKFLLVNCSNDPIPKVRDFYQPGNEIEIEKIDVITGILFGRRETFLQIGGFRSVPSTDTDLFQRVVNSGGTYKKLDLPTYCYYFGRDHQSEAIKDNMK